MAEQLKVSIPNEVCLTTIRTQNSQLWFVNNKKVEREILSYLAKYQTEFGVIIYAFILMGNHYHMVAKFPRGNRHLFKKAFNRIFANILKRHDRRFRGGHVWARRYRPQGLPRPVDVKHWFFYTVCNPISSGLVPTIYQYQSFNSFFMSLSGQSRKFEFFDIEKYQNAVRYNQKLTKEDCTKVYELTISRLPGYEDMSQEDYRKFLLGEYIKRRKELVKARKELNKGFMGVEKLKAQSSGGYPLKTKKSDRHSHRPLYLTLCADTRKLCLDGYFSILADYKAASQRYRKGKLATKFPPGTFRPPAMFEQCYRIH